MIEVANRDPHSAESIDELLDILGLHIGRTVKIESPAYRATAVWPYIPPTVNFGTLKWVRRVDKHTTIQADLGRPYEVRDHNTCELINLTDTISVLSDGAWHLLHAPKKDES